jgi:hypothetical protein
MALNKAAPPAREAPAVKREDRAFAIEGVKITTPTVRQVLSKIMQGVALIAPWTFSGRELVVMGTGIAEPQSVCEAAKIALLVLASLLLLLALP